MKRKNQITLPNGCWCSQLSVTPKNWKSGGASLLNRPWRIAYRFYDPNHVDKKGKVFGHPVRKNGMNEFQDLTLRREATQTIKNDELALLKEGWNPRLQRLIEPEKETGESITEWSTLSKALKSALNTIELAPRTKRDITYTLAYINKAAVKAKVAQTPICEVRLKHIRAILDAGPKIKEVWNNNQFNVFKKYMGILFRELMQRGLVEHNPANAVFNRKVIKSEREEITPDLRRKIDLYLRKKKMMRFRLWLRIFFSLASRETELLQVQAKDVTLKDQYVWVTIYKGTSYIRVKKTIPTNAVRYWKLAIKGASPDEYLFGRGLKPGPKPVRVEQLNRRWRTQIKENLKIDRDMYEMKHSRTTAVSNSYSEEYAAAANNHATLKLMKIYDLDSSKRKHEALKKVNVAF